MRLLVLSVSAGAGHLRAGQALEATCRLRYPGVLCAHRDVLEFTSAAFRRFYARGYLATVNSAPRLWGYLYDISDRKTDRSKTVRLMKLFDQAFYARFREYVREFAPDHVLSTHYLPSRVLLARRRPSTSLRGEPEAPVSVVVTDYDVHTFWKTEGVRRYFVASDEVRWNLARRGVQEDKITVSGIPIDPVFEDLPDRALVREKLGLAHDAPAVLILAGGFGVGDVAQSVENLLALDGNHQLLVVSGRNQKLLGRLRGLRAPEGKRLRVFGFVDNIHELMAASDLVVTKPGGLTVSECLAAGRPMVLYAPIPGQEDRNADYVLEQGAGVKAKDGANLCFKLREILRERRKLAELSRAAAAAGKPRAARAILSAVLE